MKLTQNTIIFIIALFLLLLRFIFGNVVIDSIKRNMYYIPSKIIFSKPNNDIESVYLTNNEGNQLNGWYYKGNSYSDKTILYCHGNAGNISGRHHIIQKFIDKGISVLMFDYRGYGLSEGYTTTESSYQDAVDWMIYLINNKQVNKKDIIPMGESIGSYPAARLADEHNLSKVIIFAGFHNMSDVVINLFPVPINHIASYVTNGDLETGKHLKNHKGKKLILHSKSDEIISFDNAIKNSSYGGELVTVEGGHNDHNIDYDIIKNFIYK